MNFPQPNYPAACFFYALRAWPKSLAFPVFSCFAKSQKGLGVFTHFLSGCKDTKYLNSRASFRHFFLFFFHREEEVPVYNPAPL